MRLVLVVFLVVVACQRDAGRAGRRPAVRDPGVELAARTDRTEYGFGQPITLMLGVRNPGAESAVLRFPTAQRYDFVVTDRTGLVVWQWSTDRAFAQAGGELTVPAGWEVSYEERLTERLPAGTYRVVATLTAEGVRGGAVANFAVR
jgi:hypothetical protein